MALEARVRLAVPPARGLGSSATAIVAGLMGANALVGEPLSKDSRSSRFVDGRVCGVMSRVIALITS